MTHSNSLDKESHPQVRQRHPNNLAVSSFCMDLFLHSMFLLKMRVFELGIHTPLAFANKFPSTVLCAMAEIKTSLIKTALTREREKKNRFPGWHKSLEPSRGRLHSKNWIHKPKLCAESNKQFYRGGQRSSGNLDRPDYRLPNTQ